MEHDNKRWFIEKIAQNPEYLAEIYLPALDRISQRAQNALDLAIRNDGIERIKYQMGRLDGVRETCALLGVLKGSEGRKPAGPGLLARIFPGGWSEDQDIPSKLG